LDFQLGNGTAEAVPYKVLVRCFAFRVAGRKRRNALNNRAKQFSWIITLIALVALPARAQDLAVTAAVATPAPTATPAPRTASWGVPEGRTFFPHDWIRGYVDYEVAPPHNEPDLGRCTQEHATIVLAGGPASPCNAYARYLLGGYLEIQPFGKTFMRHVFVFYTPMFSFGNNVPQFKYTASMAGIAYERALGFAVELPKNFEFRVTQHQVDWLGKYRHDVGGTTANLDLHTAGPYGLYSTVGARWYFGGYGHSREGR
jgi:hypothetical protein